MYHDVYDKKKAESGFQNQEALVYKINVIDFENQVKKISSFKEKYDIRFTFDDGGSSFYTLIAPILEKYNFKGYYFISSDFINKKGFLKFPVYLFTPVFCKNYLNLVILLVPIHVRTLLI